MIFILLTSVAIALSPEYTFLYQGDVAPFNGRLMNEAAIDLITEQLVNGPKECQIQSQYQLSLLEAEKNEEIRRLKNDHRFNVDLLEIKITEQKTRIEELETLKTPPKQRFWFSLGLISGVATTIAIAQAVQ